MTSQVVYNKRLANEFFMFLANEAGVLKHTLDLDWRCFVWLDSMSPEYFNVNWNTLDVIPKTPNQVLQGLWNINER